MERLRRLVFFCFEKWQICFFFLPGVNGLQPFALPCAGRSERIKWGPEKKKIHGSLQARSKRTNRQAQRPGSINSNKNETKKKKYKSKKIKNNLLLTWCRKNPLPFLSPFCAPSSIITLNRLLCGVIPFSQPTCFFFTFAILPAPKPPLIGKTRHLPSQLTKRFKLRKR